MRNSDIIVNARKLMLTGILLFLCAWFLGTEEYRKSPAAILNDAVMMTLIIFIQWLIITVVMTFFQKRYPGYDKVLRRIIFSVTVSGLLGMLTNTLIYEVPGILLHHSTLKLPAVLGHFGPMFFFSALVVGARELLYGFFELRRRDKEKEELLKAQLQSQLDSLKSQVNPHFLFNSLNTLLSLISISPARAEKFVLELSSVYRYLLQVNESGLNTLQQEMQFARSYFHLLKTRFGEAIQLEEKVDENYMSRQLPSLTLQLLLENAVKHNVVSMSKPLLITLATIREDHNDKAFLLVQNNLQRKTQAVMSSRMGLSNILAKFKLLNEEDMVVSDNDMHFTVKVPLLKNRPV